MKKINSFVSTIIVFLIFQTTIYAQHKYNLHLITFYDNEDQKISENCKRDIEIVNEYTASLRDIMQKYCNTNINIINYNPQNDYSTKKLDSIFLNLKVQQNDIILFVYSGHGFHSMKQSADNKFPFMYFTENDKKYNILRVHQALLKSNPRLLITIGDLCNTLLDSNEVDRELALSSDLNIEYKNYIKLFNESRGDLVIAGSSPGEPSWPWPGNGSYFNMSFWDSLVDVLQYYEDDKQNKGCNEATWECVTQRTYELTVKRTEQAKKEYPQMNIQHPIFKINVK